MKWKKLQRFLDVVSGVGLAVVGIMTDDISIRFLLYGAALLLIGRSQYEDIDD